MVHGTRRVRQPHRRREETSLDTQRDEPPRVDLTMVGDWGTANVHTVLGWIAAHMGWRCASRSKFTVEPE